MIKWLISQQVRAVNTSSKITKETEEEKQTGREGERVEERPKR